MSRPDLHGGGSGRSARTRIAAAVCLALAGTVAVVWGLSHQVSAPPLPTAQAAGPASAVSDSPEPPASTPASSTDRPSQPTSTSTTTTSATTADAAVAALPRSRPTRIQIPGIGVDATVVSLGVAEDGTLQTPARYQDAGWFRPGPAPGSNGGAVLAGHVTYNGAKGVFYALGRLKAHDTIRITRADGAVLDFSVTANRVYSKDHFPTGEVYGAPGGPTLRLITCGGDYDSAHHTYPDNVVVFATLTKIERRPH